MRRLHTFFVSTHLNGDLGVRFFVFSVRRRRPINEARRKRNERICSAPANKARSANLRTDVEAKNAHNFDRYRSIVCVFNATSERRQQTTAIGWRPAKIDCGQRAQNVHPPMRIPNKRLVRIEALDVLDERFERLLEERNKRLAEVKFLLLGEV